MRGRDIINEIRLNPDRSLDSQFLTDYAVVDRIIHHLKLSFIADKPPLPQVAFQKLLVAAKASAEYDSLSSL